MSPKMEKDEAGGKVLNWASQLDPNALEQAQRVARLPFIYQHVALMPDAHYGYGSTVGSVIATKGAVIPSAIGVDIGCLDADTEYLSPNGWVKISEYVGGPVMQYNPEDQLGELVDPIAYIKRPETKFYHLKTKYGIDQKITGDHRVLVWDRVGRDRRYVQNVVSGEDFVSKHEAQVLGNKSAFETSFILKSTTQINLSDEQLKVQVMFMADGTLGRKIGNRGTVKLKKARKIERCEQLLNKASIEYSRNETADGCTSFSFVPPLHQKSYFNFYQASLDQLITIGHEALLWDGNREDQVFFSRDRESADFMSYCFAATGWRSVMREDIHKDGKTDFRVFRHAKTRVAMAGTPKSTIEVVPSTDGYSYCFTVPSGFLVMRRNGKVFMTGNCGMVATKLPFTADLLPDNLGKLHELIREVVPAGVGKGHDKEAKAAKSLLDGRVTLTQKQEDTMAKQMGTLGSGNHFVEVCVDETDRVWVVLHSGSRGIGNQLANIHIDGAKDLMKKYFIELEDPGLAYLVEGTPQFEEYIRAMLWSQDYAFVNRQTMMDSILIQMQGFVGHQFEPVQTINCHHNFCQKENHDGNNVWVTRKGAVQSQKDQWGIVPGSMGTETYIVQGLGNDASFHSSSHGAGRVMGRKQAKKTLDLDGFKAQMEGKVWDDRKAEALLDEDPRSYKDITQVMEDQKDLVSVRHTLTQILNYKGV